MSNQGIRVEYSALDGYVGNNGGLADDVAGTANQHLSGQLVSSDMLGDLGEETGLHSSLNSDIGQLHDHVHTASHSVRNLGTAVHNTRQTYAANEDDHQQHFRGIQA